MPHAREPDNPDRCQPVRGHQIGGIDLALHRAGIHVTCAIEIDKATAGVIADRMPTTAILNAYVHPRIAGYLTALEQRLADRGVPARALLTKSNGGVMNAA